MEKRATSNIRESAEEWFQIVAEKVGSLRYGVVQIVVHEGRVIQIERTEKLRLAPTGRGAFTMSAEE